MPTVPPIETPEDLVEVQTEPVETVEPITEGDPAFSPDGTISTTPMEIDSPISASTDEVTVAND